MALSYSLDLYVPKTPLTTGGGGEIVAQEQVKAMNFAVLKAKGEILPRIPGNTGASRKSVQTQVFGEKVELTGRVFSPMGHMLALEGGAHWPGAWPPIGPLRLWAQRKFSVPEGEARSIAFLVARKLKRSGMVARHFFRDGFAQAKPAIEARWAQALVTIKARLMK